MNHYITPDNKTYGFDDTQVDLIPNNAVLIPTSYSFDQYPYLSLVNDKIVYDQEKHNADLTEKEIQQQNIVSNKQSALSKLTALGLTVDEIKTIIG